MSKMCENCPIWPIVEELKTDSDPINNNSVELNGLAKVIKSAHKAAELKPDIYSHNLRKYIDPSGRADLQNANIGTFDTAEILDAVASCFTSSCHNQRATNYQ